MRLHRLPPQGRLLLCEEKDRLLEEYGIFTGTADQADSLQDGAVAAPGAQRLRRRSVSGSAVADALYVYLLKPTVEDVVLFLVKGAKEQ